MPYKEVYYNGSLLKGVLTLGLDLFSVLFKII